MTLSSCLLVTLLKYELLSENIDFEVVFTKTEMNNE